MSPPAAKMAFSVDDFDRNAAAVPNQLDDLRPVGRLAHGAGGAGAVVTHGKGAEERREALQCVTQRPGLRRTDMSPQEDVVTQTNRHPHEGRLLVLEQPVLVTFNVVDEEPDGIRTDIDGSKRISLHGIRFFGPTDAG